MEAQRRNTETIKKSAKKYQVSEQIANNITEVSNGLGVPVEFVDALEYGAEGKYENGKIYISKNTTNPVHEVFKHELTHHLETTGSYAKFQDVMFKLAEKQGYDIEQLKKSTQIKYAKEGIELDEANLNAEVTAILSQDKIFNDQGTINDLAQLDINVAQKILKWIQEKIFSFSEKSEARTMMLKAERLYRNAIKEAQKQNVTDKSSQYLIAKTTDGEDIVVADKFSFTSKDIRAKSITKQVKNEILNNIKKLFTINSDGMLVNFNKNSAKEFLYSKYNQKLSKNERKYTVIKLLFQEIWEK